MTSSASAADKQAATRQLPALAANPRGRPRVIPAAALATAALANTCSPGLAPGAPADLDWNENAAQTSVRPQIKGNLCLQTTSAEARVAVVYHQLGGQTITKFNSSPGTGNGSSLSTFYVDEIGSRGWDTVPGAELVMYP